MSKLIEKEIAQLLIRLNECETLLCDEKIKENYEQVSKKKVIFISEKDKEKYCELHYSDPRLMIRPINIAIIESYKIDSLFEPIAISEKNKNNCIYGLNINAQTFRNNFDTLIKYDTVSKGKWHTLLSPYIINKLAKHPITLYKGYYNELEVYVDKNSYDRGVRCKIIATDNVKYSGKFVIEVYVHVVFNPNDV